jgi:hypothetical protein
MNLQLKRWPTEPGEYPKGFQIVDDKGAYKGWVAEESQLIPTGDLSSWEDPDEYARWDFVDARTAARVKHRKKLKGAFRVRVRLKSVRYEMTVPKVEHYTIYLDRTVPFVRSINDGLAFPKTLVEVQAILDRLSS